MNNPEDETEFSAPVRERENSHVVGTLELEPPVPRQLQLI